ERKCQYWGLILKLSSFSSDIVRATFIKILSLIINDKRLSGVFGGNCCLTQNVLFEYFTNDALLCSLNNLFINLIVNLFIDLLSDIHSSDKDEEEISFDRRLWPSSEGYDNVFVSENESYVFGANWYLTQHFLFEYFTNDALLCSSNDLFINLIVNLFIDLLNMIFIRMMKTKKK
ncbi:unnamed protein product, partial [Rotaria sp. Silwood1]